MGAKGLKYVVTIPDRRGVERHYFRAGGKYTRLPGKPGEAEFLARYSKLLERKPSRVRPNVVGVPARGYVYFLVCGERIKIGFTTQPDRRLVGLKTGISVDISAYVAVRGTKNDETALHRRLSAYRVQGEWFAASRCVRQMMMRSIAFGRVMIGDPLTKKNNEATGAAKSSDKC